MSSATVGYAQLLRQNRNFRRLWYGQIVSQLGDWLDSIALFTLLLTLTGSGEALGLLLVAEFLPGAVVGPLAGVVIDRLPRKQLLIVSDLGRAALVLLFFLVDGPGDVWLIYLAVVLKMSLSALFEPTRSAILPSICSRAELVSANAISGATWSAMLALGAAIGGLVAGTLGVQAAFALDAASFLLSAALIATVQVGPRARSQAQDGPAPSAGAPAPGRSGAAARLWALALRPALRELAEGWGYVLRQRELLWLTFTKALWSLGGGVLLLLTIFGREVYPLGRDGAISIGLLYAARGIGTGIGPLVALRLGGDGATFLRRAVAVSFFITGAGYLAFSGVNALPLAMLAVLFAHIGGSIQWVFSTALIQRRVPDRLLGRVFATEYAGLTLATALSSYLTGLASDGGVGPRSLTVILATVFLVVGALVAVVLWPDRRAAGGAEQAA